MYSRTWSFTRSLPSTISTFIMSSLYHSVLVNQFVNNIRRLTCATQSSKGESPATIESSFEFCLNPDDVKGSNVVFPPMESAHLESRKTGYMLFNNVTTEYQWTVSKWWEMKRSPQPIEKLITSGALSSCSRLKVLAHHWINFLLMAARSDDWFSFACLNAGVFANRAEPFAESNLFFVK